MKERTPAEFAAEVGRLKSEALRTGAIDLGGKVFYLRCGQPTPHESRTTGRVFDRPCLKRRDHAGGCSPEWDGGL